MKLRKGDNVKMLSGKDKGKTGKVISLMPREEKVVIEGLNLLTKHVRPQRQGAKGQTITIPRRVSAGKAQLICPQCSQPTRVGWRLGDKKERICKKCSRSI